MPVTDADTKTQRLLELQMLFWRSPGRSLRTAEIAAYLRVTERTARNYLDELTASGRLPLYKEGWDWRLLEDARMALLPVNLDLEEGAQLYLAARLLARHSDEPNPAIRAALAKLISAMPPTLSGHLEHLVQGLSTQADPRYAAVFRAVVYGWATRRVLDLEYHPLRLKPYRARFRPYLLEPSAIGYTVYAIGHSDPPGALRTYKLERIRSATLTDEPFDLPAGFDGMALLQQAWGVMFGEEPQAVRLRFSSAVARRVKETVWHPSQTVLDLEDGRVDWTAQVGDWLEMLPWIRGWGADVEVIEPEELREALVNETHKMALLYQVGNVAPQPLYQKLWAKADKRTGKTHPLICHMIDVAQVTLELWRTALTMSIRAQFAEALGVDEESAERTIAFWAGLHDLGKASPAFQRKRASAEDELSQAGLVFPRIFANEPFSHGTASARLLPALLESETGLLPRLAQAVARALGGHHGAWPTPAELQDLKSLQLGGDDWDRVRRDLVHALADCLHPPAVPQGPRSVAEGNALWTLISGFASVADWIGSMEEMFPYTDLPTSLDRYAEQSARRAQRALHALNWATWTAPAEVLPFAHLFQVPAPRPMQAQVMELAGHLDRPALVIIEAPTGVGKTEAALYLADHWTRTLQQRGLYVAMPTMATSNQMYGRVRDVLDRRYPQNNALPLLVHSQARWVNKSLPPDVDITDERQGDEKGSIEVMAWFLPRKRSLLAPFGVGTVDQALLSVLQTRHFFVRLFGLSHKTVIFDEVHAYDTYMSSLFQRLLAWLRAAGTSVIILSATLPAKTRRELLQAYAGTAADVPPAPYPSITWAMDGQIGTVPVAAPEVRTLTLECVERAPEAIARTLSQALREGGCAAVICNTVGRAQQVYQTLRNAGIVPEDNMILFHARFPFGWRDAVETKVLARFGKDGNRPHKAIVVATQVIEQSLDLDFDVMVSDLAPVDLILQRAGRLHRHARGARPEPLRDPRLLVAAPDVDNGIPALDRSDTSVYEAYVLLRSYLALQGRTCITLPADTAPLIEAVYGEETPMTGALASALAEAKQKMDRHEADDVYKARLKLIAAPQADNLLSKSNLGLAEDSPDLHAAFQALTRLGPPSVSLVCLHRVRETLNTEPDGSGQTVNLDYEPDDALTGVLVRSTVAVSNWHVVNHYREQQAPPGWREHPLLNRYHVAVFERGLCPLEGSEHTLRLTRELGLEVLEGGANAVIQPD